MLIQSITLHNLLSFGANTEVLDGHEFNPNALPARTDVEHVDKTDVLRCLKNATRSCPKKNKHRKGSHSFDLIARIDPSNVIEASNYARRLIEALPERAEG